MNKYIIEFIGTFFLVLTIGMTVIGLPAAVGHMAPLAIGSILMVMIFAGGHISGAHYNPAVTLGVFIRGRCSAADAGIYMVVQILAGFLAAMIVNMMLPEKSAALPAAATFSDVVRPLIAEFLGAFALVWVVLNTATSKDHPNNSFYGLAIGFTVTAMAYAFGGISGGAFNPAVAVGISAMSLTAWANIWVFLVANLAAGAVAGILFKITNTHDK